MTKDSILLVIGASAGGNAVLPNLISQLDPDMKISVMVVMHLSRASIGELLLKRIQGHTSLSCTMPSNGDPLKDGHLYLAVPNHHLLVKKGKVLVGNGPMENRYRPSIDALFRSAAVAYGPRVIGIILSGMLEDGASGMHAIRKCGGICIVQSPEEAKYPDMPQAVLSVLKPDYIVPVNQMGDSVRKALSTARERKSVPIDDDLIKEATIAERVNVGMEHVERVGETSPISCPDCGGSLWEIKDDDITRYRCHVGHAFSEEGLINSMEVSTEATLWTALRMLEERKSLLQRLGEKENKRGRSHAADTYLQKSRELEAHVRKLKEIIFAVAKRSH